MSRSQEEPHLRVIAEKYVSKWTRHVASRDLVLSGYDEHPVFESLCRRNFATAHD